MDTNTILATGAVAVVSGIVGGSIPGVFRLVAEWLARRGARREVVADLAGELLEGCERLRASSGDVPVNAQMSEVLRKFTNEERPEWRRARDDHRASLRSLAVRIGVRNKKLGESALALISAAERDAKAWESARDAFSNRLFPKFR
ncbi:hypothetical protein [Brachybacterium sp. AG952]|uniref:hypothetical protein n=1 Tax=Brachybacterium sp. AG952 TaxID=2183989 RepID=UPI00105F4A61|nr:hypothetical protein [Brachybacterium sp. AG952]